MGFIHVCVAAFIALAVQTTEAQCVSRVRQAVPTRTYMTSHPFPPACPSCPAPQPCPSCSGSSADDLNKLILLAKMLIEKNSEHAAKNHINAEAIIKRLIDALIYTTMQYNNCRAVLDKVLTSGNGGGSGGSGGSAGGAGGGAGGGKALIDLGLLNPSSPNNVLDLGLAGQDLLGVGLGKPPGSGSSSTGSSGSKGGSSSGNPSLIDLGLLRPNQQDNVLDLGLAGTNLLGVGIGNTDGSGSNGNSSSSGASSPGGSSGGNSSQKGLIDLTLLNPDSSNNVLDLSLAGQDVLGVGLGNPQ